MSWCASRSRGARQASFKLLSSLECSIKNKALGLGWERGKGCLSHSNNEEEEEERE